MARVGALQVGLYKIFVYFELFVHESNLLSFLAPPCIPHTVAILLHNDCAVYDPPSTSIMYAIQHTILVITISCKGQVAGLVGVSRYTLLLLTCDPHIPYSATFPN